MAAAFEWKPCTPVSRSCEWDGLYMEAFQDGRWKVAKVRTPGNPLVSHKEQAQVRDIRDAERRAQAAALIIQQLAQQKP